MGCTVRSEESPEGRDSVKRIGKEVLGILTALYMAVLGVMILPGFFGCRVETVTSGSMEPAIRTGAMIYVRQVDFEKIAVDDVITYRLKDGKTKVTHRVAEKDAGSKSFITKGDANDAEDAGKVEYDRVEGKVILTVPFLGRIALLLTNIYGKIILAVSLLALFVLYSFLAHSGQRAEEGRAGEASSE